MDKHVNESGLEPKQEIQELVRRSREAQKQIENYTQEQVDELIRAMVWCVARPGVAEEIAQFTVDETQLGNYEGKFLKIQRKTRATLMDIIDEKSVGILEEDKDLAKEIGLLLSILLKKNSEVNSENNEQTSELSIQTREAS